MDLRANSKTLEEGSDSTGGAFSHLQVHAKRGIPEISENQESNVGGEGSSLQASGMCASISVMKEICMLNEEINELFDGIAGTSALPDCGQDGLVSDEKFNAQSIGKPNKLSFFTFKVNEATRGQNTLVSSAIPTVKIHTVKHKVTNHAQGQKLLFQKADDDSLEIRTGLSAEFRCTVCLKLFTSDSELKLHVQDLPSQTFFLCLKCEMYFCVEFKLKEHVSADHCGASDTLEFRKLQVERRFHNNKYSCYCEICKQYVGGDGRLANHLNNFHKGAHGRICTLAKHELVLSDSMLSRTYQCDVCRVDFHCSRGLSLHQRRIHNVESKNNPIGNEAVNGNVSNNKVPKLRFRCETCRISFLGKGALGIHKRTHKKLGQRKEKRAEKTISRARSCV